MNGKIMLNGKAYSSSGRPSKEITMAQWLALPDTKYTDGVVYYIKDVGGANQFPPLIYSYEEREVGVWRDGKPLYQRTIIGGEITTTNITVLWDGADVDTICNFECIFYDSYNLSYLLNYYFNSSEWCRLIVDNESIWATGKGVCFQKGNSQGVSKTQLTVWYTKTTDTAGSGTWTNDGTYAHHYSTSEKVVGTWIDGKPLYERSFTKTLANSPDADASSFLVASNVTGIETLVKMEGTIKAASAYAFAPVCGLPVQVGWNYAFHINPSNQLVVWTSNVSANYSQIAGGTAICTIQYTKTTD